MKINENNIYCIFVAIVIFLMLIVWKKNTNKHVRAFCYFCLIWPVLSFQEISHRTLAGFIIAVVLAIFSHTIPACSTISKKSYVVGSVCISILIAVSVFFDFSPNHFQAKK